MTQNATVKKIKTKHKMIIIAQFIYDYFRSILLFEKRAHVWNLNLCKSFMSYDTCGKARTRQRKAQI